MNPGPGLSVSMVSKYRDHSIIFFTYFISANVCFDPPSPNDNMTLDVIGDGKDGTVAK